MKSVIVMKKIKTDEELFNDSVKIVGDSFKTSCPFKKKKITQGLFWSNLDKDIADQFIREEAWLFGIKFIDNIKFINHYVDYSDKDKNSKIGF